MELFLCKEFFLAQLSRRSITTWPVTTKLGIKHSSVEGIYGFFSNKGSSPFTRGDNNEIAKIPPQN